MLASVRQHSDAIRAFEQAVAINPANDVAVARWGTSLAALGKDVPAIDKFHAAIKMNPDNGYAYGRLGTSLRAIGRDADAITAYKKALEIDPVNRHALGNLGRTLADLGRHEDAIANYIKLAEVDPKNVLLFDVWADSIRSDILVAGRLDCAKLHALFEPFKSAAAAELKEPVTVFQPEVATCGSADSIQHDR